ncbi:tryptophan synthase beta chain [Pseudonocardia sp. N23]|nr:tryptophan synthase beta chain [Pseudonocardia sp. N23]
MMSLRDVAGPDCGPDGGSFMPEALVGAVENFARAHADAVADPLFRAELVRLWHDYTGRPFALTEATGFAACASNGICVLLKPEGLNRTGSHKINNTIGQAPLTRRLGKRRVVAETGAGQHGVATATAAALLGRECTIFVGAVDVARQALDVARMRLLGIGTGQRPGATSAEQAELAAARRRIAQLEAEVAIHRRANELLGQVVTPQGGSRRSR